MEQNAEKIQWLRVSSRVSQDYKARAQLLPGWIVSLVDVQWY